MNIGDDAFADDPKYVRPVYEITHRARRVKITLNPALAVQTAHEWRDKHTGVVALNEHTGFFAYHEIPVDKWDELASQADPNEPQMNYRVHYRWDNRGVDTLTTSSFYKAREVDTEQLEAFKPELQALIEQTIGHPVTTIEKIIPDRAPFTEEHNQIYRQD